MPRATAEQDGSALAQQLADHMEALTEDLLGEPIKKDEEEWAFGRKTGSLTVAVAGPKRGAWFDFALGEGGGPLALVRHCQGLDRAAARAWARAWLGGPVGGTPSWTAGTAYTGDPGETAQRIATARAIARDGLAVPDASQAAHYLAARGITAWPDSLAYTEAPHRLEGIATGALVVPATDADGRVLATQRIYLRNGAKCPIPALDGKAKRTNGRGGAWRLLGTGDGPLVLAIGPETALSVWQATGYETWAALGPMKRLLEQLPPGRTVIVAADGHAPESPPAQALSRVVEALNDGRRVLCARPPGGFDWNDVLVAGGDQAVRDGFAAAEIIAAGPPALRYGAPTHALEDARSQARGAVEGWFSEVYRYAAADRGTPPQQLVRITAGGGKSRIVRAVLTQRLRRYSFHARHLGDGPARAMMGGIIAVPTHELAQETARALHAQGVAVVVWRGREHVDADGNPACGNLDAVADAQAAYEPIERSVCRRRLPSGEALECPLYQSCAYQTQKPAAQVAEVVVLTHASLFHEPPAALCGRSWMVIDETFVDDAARGGPGAALTLDTLAQPPGGGLSPRDHARLAHLRSRATAALAAAPDGPVPTAVLDDAGITAAACREAAGLEWELKLEPDLYPGQDAKDRTAAAQQAAGQNRLVDRRARVWKLLADALERVLPAAGGVELGRHETAAGDARAVVPRWHATIRTGWPQAVLYLDATPRPAIARKHLHRLETVAELEVDAPNLRIVQIPDAPHTRRKLDPGAQRRRRDQKRTDRHLRDIHAYVQRKAREHDDGQVLVVAQEGVETALGGFRFRPNVELRHFNALRGLNTYSNHACLIVIGRPLPAAPVVEAEAAALTNEPPAVQPEAGWWYDRVRAGVRRRDGGVGVIETPLHPDPLCEQLRRQVCEDELMQVIGRLRGINRGPEDPAELVLLNDIVLPVTLDAIDSWETAAPDPIELQLAHGVAVASAAHAAHLRPDLWPSPDAARKAFARSRTYRTQDPPEPNVRLLGELPGTYQRDARGAKAVSFVFDPTLVDEPAATIEATLGDLAACEYDVETAARRRASHSVSTTPSPAEGLHASKAADTRAGGAMRNGSGSSGDRVPDERLKEMPGESSVRSTTHRG